MKSGFVEPCPTPATTNILSLANETLHEIGSLILHDSKSLTSFLLACRRTSYIAAYLRYTSLVIEGRQGRLLLTTLISGSTVTIGYRGMVKRLWFRGYGDGEEDAPRDQRRKSYLHLFLLTEVLPLLCNLSALWLDVSRVNGAYLLRRMRLSGLVRDPDHSTRSMASLPIPRYNSSPYTLPRLMDLRIGVEPAICGISAYRPLRSVHLSYPMDGDDLERFIVAAEGGVLGRSLRTLSIHVTRALSSEMVIPLLSSTFAALRFLSFTQVCLDPSASSRICQLCSIRG